MVYAPKLFSGNCSFLLLDMEFVSPPSSIVKLDGEYLFKRGCVSDNWPVLRFCGMKMEELMQECE